MSVHQVNAAERFDEVSLSNEVHDGQVGSLYTKYSCPSCKEQVAFSRMDFETRGRHKTSNLSSEHAAEISAFAQASTFRSEQYLDWYCPKCRLPTRAYFRQWAGGHHGDSGVVIVAVVELPKDAINAL